MTYDFLKSAKKHNAGVVMGLWALFRSTSGSKIIETIEMVRIYCEASITH